MSVLLAILALLGTVALAWAASSLKQLSRAVSELEQGVQALSKDMAQEQVRIEEVLAVTTTSVEDMHRAISDVSFDILEAMPRTREAGKRMRNVHDTYATNLYGGVRVLGKGIGVLRSRSKQRDGGSENPHSKPQIKTIEGRYEALEPLDSDVKTSLDIPEIDLDKKSSDPE